MLHLKENKKKILNLFFKNPLKSFYLREVSRKTKIAVTSVKKYLSELIKEGLIEKKEGEIYPYFQSTRENDDGIFRFYKKLNLIEELETSGLLKFLEEKCAPFCIILFGSCSRGEDVEGSDIDLFIQSSELKLDLLKFEKILGREISLFFEKDFSKLSKELKNNLLNGVVVKGYIEVFK